MSGTFVNLLLHILKVLTLNWEQHSYNIFARDEICLIGTVSQSGQANSWALAVCKSPENFEKIHIRSLKRFRQRAYGEYAIEMTSKSRKDVKI